MFMRQFGLRKEIPPKIWSLLWLVTDIPWWKDTKITIIFVDLNTQFTLENIGEKPNNAEPIKSWLSIKTKLIQIRPLN